MIIVGINFKMSNLLIDTKIITYLQEINRNKIKENLNYIFILTSTFIYTNRLFITVTLFILKKWKNSKLYICRHFYLYI